MWAKSRKYELKFSLFFPSHLWVAYPFLNFICLIFQSKFARSMKNTNAFAMLLELAKINRLLVLAKLCARCSSVMIWLKEKSKLTTRRHICWSQYLILFWARNSLKSNSHHLTMCEVSAESFPKHWKWISFLEFSWNRHGNKVEYKKFVRRKVNTVVIAKKKHKEWRKWEKSILMVHRPFDYVSVQLKKNMPKAEFDL